MSEDNHRLHFLPLYINDWETDGQVKLMGPVARYYYLHLLMHQWREGHIPADRRELKKLLLMPKDPIFLEPLMGASDNYSEERYTEDSDNLDYDGILEQVLKCFRSDGRGHLYNPRLETVRRAQLARFCNLSARGKQGRIKQLSATAQHNTGHSYPYTDVVVNASSQKPLRRKQFQKPTLLQVSEYMKTLGIPESPLEAQKFLDNHDSKGWKINRNPMVDWKAAARTWQHNLGLFGGNVNGNGNKTKAEQRFEQNIRAVQGAIEMAEERDRKASGGVS